MFLQTDMNSLIKTPFSAYHKIMQKILSCNDDLKFISEGVFESVVSVTIYDTFCGYIVAV